MVAAYNIEGHRLIMQGLLEEDDEELRNRVISEFISDYVERIESVAQFLNVFHAR